jgi:two-component system KDP operon response regulator KdpE
VTVNENEVKLTPTEYELLKIFLKHRGQILTQSMLLTQIWGIDSEAYIHSLHVYIAHLRRKIESEPAHPRLLHTLHGIGYFFGEKDENTTV